MIYTENVVRSIEARIHAATFFLHGFVGVTQEKFCKELVFVAPMLSGAAVDCVLEYLDDSGESLTMCGCHEEAAAAERLHSAISSATGRTLH